jgi:ADP-ribose pyrophosphatase YjhB (NUDIX family)
MVEDRASAAIGDNNGGKTQATSTQNNVVDRNTTLFDFLKRISTSNEIPSYITTDNAAIDFILNTCKAKKYVGAGVGGLLVNEDTKEVLLYQRPKNPDKGLWSMPGGSVKTRQTIVEAINVEYSNIAGLAIEGEDKILLRVTNHREPDTMNAKIHWLSPAFIILDKNKTLINKIAEEIDKLRADNQSINWYFKDWEDDEETKIKLRKELENIDDEIMHENSNYKKELLQELKQNGEKYKLQWWSIDYIKDHKNRFSQPTRKAIESYCERSKTLEDISKELHKTLVEIPNKVHNSIKDNLHRVINSDR